MFKTKPHIWSVCTRSWQCVIVIITHKYKVPQRSTYLLKMGSCTCCLVNYLDLNHQTGEHHGGLHPERVQERVQEQHHRHSFGQWGCVRGRGVCAEAYCREHSMYFRWGITSSAEMFQCMFSRWLSTLPCLPAYARTRKMFWRRSFPRLNIMTMATLIAITIIIMISIAIKNSLTTFETVSIKIF